MNITVQRRYRYSSILKTAIPLILSLMLEQIIGLTDVAFLGHYGEIELAAAALSTVFFFILLMQGAGYSIGSQSLMGHSNGEGDKESIGLYFRQSATFLVGLAIVLTVGTLAFFPWIQHTFIQDPKIGDAVYNYLLWRNLGLPISFICVLIRSFYIATLRPKVITISAIVMVATNIIFNYILIFGWGPIPSLGIAGAAIASTISEFAALIYFVYVLRKHKEHTTYHLIGSYRPIKRIQAKLFRLGRWLMLQEALALGAWFIFFIAVEHLGSVSLGIANVVRQAGSVLFIFIHALGTTCGSIAANLLGAGYYDEIKPMARRGMLLSLMCITPIVAVYTFFPQSVLSLFTNIDSVLQAAEPTFFIMLLGYVAALPCYHYYFILGAVGMAKESSITSVIATLFYIAYIFCLPFLSQDVAFYWTTDWLYALILGIGGWYFWRKVSWRKIHQRAINH